MRTVGLNLATPLLTACLLALAPVASAQAPAVDQAAPSISLENWLNLAPDESPSLDSLAGKPILLEFWGTWCHPCVLAMPLVQKLHDRYREHGLKLLAISYETEEVLQPFLAKNAYTMAVGSDPTKKVVNAYAVRSWPTSVLIGGDGKIAYIGDPYSVEPAIEKALGLEASVGALLTRAIESLASNDKKSAREPLRRLIEKEPMEFDLKAWAAETGGAAGAAKPSQAADQLLDRCVQAWGSSDPTARAGALAAIAAMEPPTVDLLAWANARFCALFPITAEEMKDFLAAKSHEAAIDALIDRNPPAAVVQLAAKDKELRGYSVKKAEEARLFAKKGLMIENWVLPGRFAKNNDEFWAELSINAVSTAPDKKTTVGVVVGATNVNKSNVAAFVKRQFSRAFVMESLAAGKPPKLGNLESAVAKERAAQLKVLESRYPIEK